MEKFELGIESRWIRTKRTYSQSGFIILVPPGNMLLQRYIDYLSERNKKLSEGQ
ncbi:MAG: hypothetical protein LBP76_08460 [Treponema sp.]|nr:hypothetical protein [Treponema sp.]